MTRDNGQSRITFGVSERIAIVSLLIAVLGLIGSAYYIYREHDRDLTTIKTEMLAVKIEIADLRRDVKQLANTVSALDALVRRQASSPVEMASASMWFEVGQ